MTDDNFKNGDLALSLNESSDARDGQLSSSKPPMMSAQAYEPDNFDVNDHRDSGHGEDEEDEYDLERSELGLANDRFTEQRPVYYDTAFSIFFLAVVFLFTIIAMRNVYKHLSEYRKAVPFLDLPDGAIHFGFGAVIYLILTIIVSFAISGAIFFTSYKFPYKSVNLGIKVAMGLLVFMSFVVGYPFSIFCLGVAGISFYILKYKKPSIDLASKVLIQVFKVLENYPSAAVFSFFGFAFVVLLENLFAVVVGTTMIDFGFNPDGTHIIDDNGNDISGGSFKLIFTILFVSFAKFYITDVLKNIIHTSVAGVYGSCYYLQGTFNGVPLNEGLKSLKRSMTYNLGSICCGSLFVVFFQLVYTMLTIFHFEQFGIIGKTFVGILSLSAILVGYFNLYVFSYVGIYGKAFYPSFSSIVKFFRERGVHAAKKDFVVSGSLFSMTVAAPMLSAFSSSIFLILGSLFGFTGSGVYIAVMISTYLITAEICSVAVATILSGSVSFFLALNKDPAVFEESDPYAFQEFSACYPPILDRVDFD